MIFNNFLGNVQGRLLHSTFVAVVLLGCLVSFNDTMAEDMIAIDRSSVRKGAVLKSQGDHSYRYNPVKNDASGISHNLFERFSLDGDELVLNNNSPGSDDTGQTVRTIIIEVVGHKPTKLRGTIKVIGERANLIIANSRGIVCEGCHFSNVAKVELNTDIFDDVINGKIKWLGEITEGIKIEKDGLSNLDGSLVVDAKKIVVDGNIDVKDNLILYSHAGSADTKNRNHGSIDIKAAVINAGRIELHNLDHGSIKIASNGEAVTTMVSRSDLLLKSPGNINIAALIKSNGALKIVGNKISGDGNFTATDGGEVFSRGVINLNSITFNGNVALVANGDIIVKSISGANGIVKVYGKKLQLMEVSNMAEVYLYGKNVAGGIKFNNVGNIEILDNGKGAKNVKSFSVESPLDIEGDFIFSGQSFSNHGLFKANNIKINLRGDFFNDDNGEIVAREKFQFNGRDFTNNNKINIDGTLNIKGDRFINEGEVNAGPVEIYLMGKAKNDTFIQRSGSRLESRGGMELLIPAGGVYFESTKQPTSCIEEDCSLQGTRLFSHDGDIHILSGGDVILDGAQTKGRIVVDVSGNVEGQENSEDD